MKTYQIWVMPEKKEKGQHDKWIEENLVEAKNRKSVTAKLHSERKSGTWKVRMI